MIENQLINFSKNIDWSSQSSLIELENETSINNIYLKFSSHQKDSAHFKHFIKLSSLPFTFSDVGYSSLNLLRDISENCCNRCNDTEDEKIFGTGNLEAKFMFIGDAPGVAKKDMKTNAWVAGRSSKMLKEALSKINIVHKSWFTNLLKCPMKDNKPSYFNNVYNCFNLLKNEIEIIDPYYIILMGKKVKSHFEKLGFPYSRCIYHPSYYLRLGKKPKDYAKHIKEELKNV